MNKLGKFKKIFLYVNAVLLLLVLGAGTYYTVTLYSKAQSCFTAEQVQQSNDCLYIYNNGVYKKGTRDAPHQGTACGTDVSAIIPNSHMLDKIGHLDPNYLGDICANNPNPTATPQPTATTAPTSPPAATATTAPVATTAPSPTSGQASNFGTTVTTAPSATPTRSSTATTNSTTTPTPTPSTTDTASSTEETPTLEPTALTTLPVTGRLEWLAAALIPVGLVVLGMIF